MTTRVRSALGLGLVLLATLVAAGCGGDSSSEVTVSPTPGSEFASPGTQISLLGLDSDDPGEFRVTGSKSGEHSGEFHRYAGAEGASFVPDKPFVVNEEVTVETGLDIVGAENGKFSFRTADFRTDAKAPEKTMPPEASMKIRHVNFRSRPDLKPPAVITRKQPTDQAAPGYFFISPKQDGPMILDGDGSLAFFQPAEAADFRAQQLNDEPVITWWEGPFNAGGYTEGSYVVLDQGYNEVKRVFAGNGYKGDLHEFVITPRNTAYLTIYRTVKVDLTEFGGPKNGAVLDSVAQEVDVDTGLVIWEWHSLDDIAIDESYIEVPESPTESFDYFHINSINDDAEDGKILISGRNTFSVVQVDRNTSKVTWRLGGKKPDFEMGKGTDFSWQHDAVRQPDGTITIFDNAGNYFGEPNYPFSRAITLEVGEPGSDVELAKKPLVHPTRFQAPSQGSFQVLEGGNSVVGWGSQPFFTEYTADGEVVSDFTYTARNSSYRTYKQAWEGAPDTLPAIATRADGNGVRIWVSWNGDTRTATWRLLGGTDEETLKPLVEVDRDGFETVIDAETKSTFLAVEAISPDGESLGRSNGVEVGQADRGLDGPNEAYAAWLAEQEEE